MGLNDGWELEGEIPDPNDNGSVEYKPSDPPFDISEETSGILAFENSVADLKDLADAIEEAGGMSQDFAVAAESICPGILKAGKNHFTQTPTATRLRVSMEEMHAGIWALIAAAVVAMLGILYKIFKWLSGGSDAKDSAGAAVDAVKQQDKKIENVEKLTDSVSNINDAIQEANALVRQGVKVDEEALTSLQQARKNDRIGKITDFSNFDSMIAKTVLNGGHYERAKAFLDNGDPVFHDILNNGPYTKMVTDAGEALLGLKDIIATKIVMMENIVHSNMGNASDLHDAKNAYRLGSTDLRKPIELRYEGKMMTLTDIARAIEDQMRKTESSKVSGTIKFDVMFKRMDEIYSKPTNRKILLAVRESVEVMSEFNQKLLFLQRFAGNVSTDGSIGTTTQELGTEIREAILGLGRDVSGYARLTHELDDYVRRSIFLAREVSGFGSGIVNKIWQALKMHGDDIPNEWQDIVDRLRRELKVLKELQEDTERHERRSKQ